MHPKTVCLVFSILAIIAGVLGMALSFLHLSLTGMGSPTAMEDVVAGGSGLVAGSILFGAGLISATLLYARGPARPGGAGEDFHPAAGAFRRQAGPED